MHTVIRKANSDDIEAISRIYEHIHTAEEQGKAVIGWVRGVYPERETAEAALSRGDLFAEEADGNIVGTAIINQIQVDTYKNAPWQYDVPDEQVMVLHTLVIDPEAKGSGFGTAFVEFYEKYAAECGCSCLRIDTNERNAAARRFYKKLGYTEIAVMPCDFNGIPNIGLVMLEKKLGE